MIVVLYSLSSSNSWPARGAWQGGAVAVNRWDNNTGGDLEASLPASHIPDVQISGTETMQEWMLSLMI